MTILFSRDRGLSSNHSDTTKEETTPKTMPRKALLLVLLALWATAATTTSGFPLVSRRCGSRSASVAMLNSLEPHHHDGANNRNGIGINRRSTLIGTFGASLAIVSPPKTVFASTPSSTATRTVPTWTLDNNGVKFPILALNTVGLSSEETERAIGYAVNDNYIRRAV